MAVIATAAVTSYAGSSLDAPLSVALAEDVVTLHEPLFLEVTLANGSAETLQADLGIAEIGAFRIDVVSQDGRIQGGPLFPPTVFHTGGLVDLRPGEHYRARHLLDEWLTIDSPGTYRVTVRFTGTVTSGESDELAVRRDFSLPLTVLPRDVVRLAEVALPLLETACRSRDPSAALDAAKTLAHIHDPAVTSLLAKMLECGVLARTEAVAALDRMGTVEATAALIEAAHSGDAELADLAQRALATR